MGGILVKGDEVELVSTKAEKAVYAPERYVMCQDTGGQYLPRCNFYVLPYRFSECIDCTYDKDLLADARKYYGDSAKLEKGLIAIPRGPWHRLGHIDAIRYRRRGYLKGSYEHVFVGDVRVDECKSPHAFRIVLPKACVANERGFVKP